MKPKLKKHKGLWLCLHTVGDVVLFFSGTTPAAAYANWLGVFGPAPSCKYLLTTQGGD